VVENFWKEKVGQVADLSYFIWWAQQVSNL
jgi:hypothetical protein